MVKPSVKEERLQERFCVGPNRSAVLVSNKPSGRETLHQRIPSRRGVGGTSILATARRLTI